MFLARRFDRRTLHLAYGIVSRRAKGGEADIETYERVWEKRNVVRVELAIVFTDHLLEVYWTVEKGWISPLISRYMTTVLRY